MHFVTSLATPATWAQWNGHLHLSCVNIFILCIVNKTRVVGLLSWVWDVVCTSAPVDGTLLVDMPVPPESIVSLTSCAVGQDSTFESSRKRP